MSKYQPLAAFLRRQRGVEVTLTFTEIERLIGRLLPKAAKTEAWWTVDVPPRQPQQIVLAQTTFEARLDARRETVRFTRRT